MSILGLNADELMALQGWLLSAVDSRCVDDWEFDSLVGCSRLEARRWIQAGLPFAAVEEHLLDQIVTMLSILAGSAHGHASEVVPGAIDQMIEKLFWSSDDVRGTRTDQQSSVGLRPAVTVAPTIIAPLPLPAPRKAPRKRRTAAR